MTDTPADGQPNTQLITMPVPQRTEGVYIYADNSLVASPNGVEIEVILLRQELFVQSVTMSLSTDANGHSAPAVKPSFTMTTPSVDVSHVRMPRGAAIGLAVGILDQAVKTLHVSKREILELLAEQEAFSLSDFNVAP